MLLRIALELDLKKAMVGGVERVYEIGRTFRNEGLDSTHAAEFSMLEAYQAYADYDTMKDADKVACRRVRRAPSGPPSSPPATDRQSISRASGGSPACWNSSRRPSAKTSTSTRRSKRFVPLRSGTASNSATTSGSGEIILELYEKLVEHTLMHPTFVSDYPASVRPLAKPHRSKPGLVEAFDLVINGVELVAAYSELNDPVIQRARLVEQSVLRPQGDPEAMELDEYFLRALEFGMPPAGGMGMGVDRLVMLLTGVGIRETILFPLLRPE